jgi:UDP-sugar transporter A1/2/3
MTATGTLLSIVLMLMAHLPSTRSFSHHPLETARLTANWRQPHKKTVLESVNRNAPSLVSSRYIEKKTWPSSSALRAVPVTSGALPLSSHVGAASMALLCLQFALQPVLTRSFASKKIERGTYVLMQDVARFLISLATLSFLNGGLAAVTKTWTLTSSLQAAGIPSLLYLVQNLFSLMAYQHLSPITYNVLNQTKTLSAAVFCYLLLGQKQSPQQMVALFLLVLAAIVMEGSLGKLLTRSKSKETTESNESDDSFLSGIIPVLIASMTSGLAGALSQKSLQTHSRNAMLFNMELSVFSMMIMSVSSVFKTVRQKTTKETDEAIVDNEKQPYSMWRGWTKQTWIPLLTNAVGGILVGLVTKYAGAVQKGFALIIGMFLSGLLQNYLPAGEGDGLKGAKKVTSTQWLGGAFAATSLWLHSSFPPT